MLATSLVERDARALRKTVIRSFTLLAFPSHATLQRYVHKAISFPPCREIWEDWAESHIASCVAVACRYQS